MSVRMVLVLDKGELVEETKSVFRRAGFDILGFTDPAAALVALEHADTVELLIAQAEFPWGMQSGASLALIAKLSRPDIKILLIGEPGRQGTVEGLVRRFVTPPVTPVALLKEARAMLCETRASAE